MTLINIKNKEYRFENNFKDNIKTRRSFNNLAKETFGFDFEEWYQNGYWNDSYRPYAILNGDIVVSNVSVTVLDFHMFGEKKRYVQIGTVMTDKGYQKQGINQYIMDSILDEWKDKCDLIFLFANDTVLEFYPKFGFTKANEYQYSKEITQESGKSDVKNLDMSKSENRNLLLDKTRVGNKFSEFAVCNNEALVMFYCTSFMSGNVYYSKNNDAIVIAEYDGHTLYIEDIFTSNNIRLEDVIQDMVTSEVKKVVLGFTPKEQGVYDKKLIEEDNTTLFILGKDRTVFAENTLMFPILSHA